MTLLIGADPEFFLLDKDLGHVISAHDLIPGTKDKPHKLKHGAVQLDGTAVEFNIDPASTPEEFSHNINEVLSQIRKMVPSRYDFYFEPFVTFKEDYFKEVVPESSKELGCNPDFNAWNFGKPNRMPAIKRPVRTGAGHIHVGFCKKADVTDKTHIEDCCMLVQSYDGIYSTIRQAWDSDNKRSSLYGNLGAFRPKPYGVEYRTPSNKWVGNRRLYPLIFKLFEIGYREALEGRTENWRRASILNYVQPNCPMNANQKNYLKADYRFTPYYDFVTAIVGVV